LLWNLQRKDFFYLGYLARFPSLGLLTRSLLRKRSGRERVQGIVVLVVVPASPFVYHHCDLVIAADEAPENDMSNAIRPKPICVRCQKFGTGRTCGYAPIHVEEPSDKAQALQWHNVYMLAKSEALIFKSNPSPLNTMNPSAAIPGSVEERR
jgi:hypothetical protein